MIYSKNIDLEYKGNIADRATIWTVEIFGIKIIRWLIFKFA